MTTALEQRKKLRLDWLRMFYGLADGKRTGLAPLEWGSIVQHLGFDPGEVGPIIQYWLDEGIIETRGAATQTYWLTHKGLKFMEDLVHAEETQKAEVQGSSRPTGKPANTAVPNYEFHPDIERVSGKLYRSGHYRQAVLDAYIFVIDRVKRQAGMEKTNIGADDMMNQVFTWDDKKCTKPRIQFNRLTTSADHDEQRGICFLFRGMVALRNVKAHVVADFSDPLRCHEYLCLTSLLLRLLDIAEELKTAWTTEREGSGN